MLRLRKVKKSRIAQKDTYLKNVIMQVSNRTPPSNDCHALPLSCFLSWDGRIVGGAVAR